MKVFFALEHELDRLNRAWGIYRMWCSIPPGRGMPKAIAMIYTGENVDLR